MVEWDKIDWAKMVRALYMGKIYESKFIKRTLNGMVKDGEEID